MDQPTQQTGANLNEILPEKTSLPIEPILQETNDRFVIFPIKHKRDLGYV